MSHKATVSVLFYYSCVCITSILRINYRRLAKFSMLDFASLFMARKNTVAVVVEGRDSY